MLGREVRETLALAWPLVGAQIFSLSMMFVDNVIVARLGPGPLAAMAMAISLVATVQTCFIGMLSPLSTLVSQEVGAGRPQVVGRTIHRGIVLAFALSALSISVCICSAPVLRALGQDRALIPQAVGFLLALAWGMPASLGYIALRQFSEGVSDTRPSVVIAAGAAVMNIFLDIGLVYGRFGLPRLELVGAGLGTAICQWCMFVSLIGYIRFNPRYSVYHLDRGEADDGHSLWEIVRLGLPFSGSLLAEVAFFAGTTLLMGTISVHAQASHQIALNAISFMFMIPLGISFAVSIRISRARGGQDMDGVRVAGEAGTLITVVTQLIAAVMFLTVPHAIAALYTSDPELTALAVSLLRIAGVFQLFDGMQVLTIGMLRGMLDTRVPLIACVISYWLVGMPCALLFAFHLQLGPQGLWYGMLAGLMCAAISLQWRFWRLLRK